jgi:hypothetical protein
MLPRVSTVEAKDTSYFLFAVCCLLFAVCCLLFAVCCLPQKIKFPILYLKLVNEKIL